jgi:hypothetical protein
MRSFIIAVIGLLCSNPTFGQTYSKLISDSEFEQFMRWELTTPDGDAEYVGVNEAYFNHASFTIDWKDLPVGIYPGRETEFDVLFKQILSDSLRGQETKEPGRTISGIETQR